MKLTNDHKQWLYKDTIESGRIFEAGDEIPEGYTDLPGFDEWDNPPKQMEEMMPDIMKMNKPQLEEFAKLKGIEVEAGEKSFFEFRAEILKALKK